MSQYKIDKLTPEQEALVPKYQEEWLGIGRSTVSMYDRKTGLQDMYRSINNLYADLKHKQPRIIRCRSPREMCNIAEILKGLWGDGKKVDPRFWDLIKDEKELNFRKGQIDILTWIATLKGISEEAYQELKDEGTV